MSDDLILALCPVAKKAGLAAMRQACQCLGIDSGHAVMVSVLGTNGKGSVVATAGAIWQAAGYRVASTTSPHLHHETERMQINGQPIAREDLRALIERVLSYWSVPPTFSYYEWSCLLAWYWFTQNACDIWCLEAGLGGRLDAINLWSADLVVLTQVALDHTQMLGQTRAQIAQEKMAVLRPGAQFVCGDINPPATVFEQEKCASRSFFRGIHFDVTEQDQACYWRYAGRSWVLPKPLLRLDNTASALMCVAALQARLPVTLAEQGRGMRSVTCPARQQWRRAAARHWLLDVAHNPASCRALADVLPDKVHCAVVGLQWDKDAWGCLQPLCTQVQRWLCVTRLPGLQHDLGAVLQRLGVAKSCIIEVSPSDLYTRTIAETRPGDTIAIFGSFKVLAKMPALML